MFEHSPVPQAEQYIIQVTEDNPKAAFNNTIFQKTDSAPATIISGFKFGGKYMWRYAGVKNGKQTKWAGPYHFEISNLPHDTSTAFDAGYYRARIINNDTLKNEGGLIVEDLTHTAITRNGQPVWFLPNPEKWLVKNGYLSDLRITPYGTATFLNTTDAVECDLNGHVLWQAPNDGKVSGDTHEYYNHVFERIDSGHYLVISKKYVWKEMPHITNPRFTGRFSFDTAIIKHKPWAKAEYSTLIEYDKQGHVTWSWDAQKYITDTDLFYPETSRFDFGNDKGGHINAFAVDKTGEFIYAGFRNYSRVVKIRKATGEVVYSWGRQMPSGEARGGHNFFFKQHDSQILSDGNIAVFNNGDYKQPEVPSSVVIFSQPAPDSPSHIVWQFDCNFGSAQLNKSFRRGNVDELANGNLLVCMGQVPLVFEITRNKQIVWETIFEPIDAKDSLWITGHLCRAHYTSSLYPCYFTAELRKSSLSQKPEPETLKIFNTGSESDSYNIKITLASGSVIRQFDTDTLRSGKSGTYQLFTGNTSPPTGKIQITVHSNTNSDFERTLVLGADPK